MRGVGGGTVVRLFIGDSLRLTDSSRGEKQLAIYRKGAGARAAEDEGRLYLLTVRAVLEGIATESCALCLSAINSVVSFAQGG